ncbi:MAG: hypothetical protein ACE15F_14455 [bacterium]
MGIEQIFLLLDIMAQFLDQFFEILEDIGFKGVSGHGHGCSSGWEIYDGQK